MPAKSSGLLHYTCLLLTQSGRCTYQNVTASLYKFSGTSTDLPHQMSQRCSANTQPSINQTAGGNPMSVRSSHSSSSRSVVQAKEVAGCGSTSMTRRSVVASGLALTAAPVTVMSAADNAHAQDKQTVPEKSLYDRLGGVFAIAAVVDHFSDAVVKNPIVGQKSKNPQLREWHTKNLG